MKIKIAITDDHQIFRKSLRRLIADTKDIEVVFEASNGLELLENLSFVENKVHLVLMDIQMPLMDGLKAAEIMQKEHPQIAIVILSQLSGEQYIKKALNHNVKGFFTKDSDPEELIKVIRKIKESNFYYDTRLEKHMLNIHNFKTNEKTEEMTFDFSKRELEVIYWSSFDLNSKEIGAKLNISDRTVEGHKNKILKKTGSNSFLGVVILALELNLIIKNS